MSSELRQQTVIAALLSEPTLEGAATRAGISYPTLYRLMREEAFISEYRAAQREAMQQATARLRVNAIKAVDTLESVMAEPGPRAMARVAAARAYLEFALRAHELDDLAARIEQLEKQARRESSEEWEGVNYGYEREPTEAASGD